MLRDLRSYGQGGVRRISLTDTTPFLQHKNHRKVSILAVYAEGASNMGQMRFINTDIADNIIPSQTPIFLLS